MDDQQLWERSPAVLWRRTARGIAVRHVLGADVVLLSGTGERLWDLLEQPRTLVELVELLGREYEAPAHEVRPGLLAALRDLAAKDVVEVSAR